MRDQLETTGRVSRLTQKEKKKYYIKGLVLELLCKAHFEAYWD